LRSSRSVSALQFQESSLEAFSFVLFRVLSPFLRLRRALSASALSAIGIDRHVYNRVGKYLLIAIGAVGRSLGRHSRNLKRAKGTGNLG